MNGQGLRTWVTEEEAQALIAHRVDGAAILPDAQPNVSTEDAFAAVKALCEPNVSYNISWDDIDGELLKRFSRKLPVEAWMVAVPVTDEGKTRRDKQMIVCPVRFDLPPSPSIKKTMVAGLVAELGALQASET